MYIRNFDNPLFSLPLSLSLFVSLSKCHRHSEAILCTPPFIQNKVKLVLSTAREFRYKWKLRASNDTPSERNRDECVETRREI